MVALVPTAADLPLSLLASGCLAAAWDDLLDDRVSTYSDRLQEVGSDEELWKVVRAWDKFNKERRKRKVRRRRQTAGAWEDRRMGSGWPVSLEHQVAEVKADGVGGGCSCAARSCASAV